VRRSDRAGIGDASGTILTRAGRGRGRGLIAAAVDMTEALLEVHEAELARLQACYRELQPMLSQINTHVDMIRQIIDFKAQTNDPDRLLSRNGRRDPGRLLREEKFRNTMAKELPKARRRFPPGPACGVGRGTQRSFAKDASALVAPFTRAQLEKSLKDALLKWEAANGKPFLVDGRRYVECLQADKVIVALNRVRTLSSTGEPKPSLRSHDLHHRRRCWCSAFFGYVAERRDQR